ncbi:hypothetical protein BC828DRAFT_393670 [Blastocladiella britannica]|nr:hypothetical protein BC828DRAFT_393670 [Blastocladiella britannica]
MPGRILDWIAASRKPSTPPPQPPPSSSAQPDTLPRSRSPGAAGAAAPANRTAGTTHRVRAQSKRRGSPSPSRSPRRMSAVLIPGTATAATTSAPTMPAPPAADSSYMGAAASLPTTHALLADNDALRAEVADLRSVILQYEHYMAATDPHVPVSVRDALAPQRPPPLAHLVAMIHPGSPTPANTVISPPTTTATMNSTAQARRPSLDGGASVRGRGRTVSSSSAASVRHHGSKRGSGKGKDRAGWTKMRKKLGRLLSVRTRLRFVLFLFFSSG